MESWGFFPSPNCFGTVFLGDNVDFDGVWLLDIEAMRDEIIAACPDRDVYISAWDPEPNIRPYESD